MAASSSLRMLRPVGPADLDAVHSLVEASDIADSGEPDLTRADVAAVLGSPAAEAWAVADADGMLIACGWVESRSGRPAVEGEFFVAPNADLAVVEPIVERMLLAAALDDDHRPLRLFVNSARPDKCELLEARGATVVRHYFRMTRGLGPAGWELHWPDGVEVRTIRDEDADVRAMHHVMTEAFRDHWGSSPAPYDEWRRRNRERADFDASLWWLVSDGGTPAAGLIGTVSDREGYVNSLGVLRSHRGLGLARGLLIRAFQEFDDRGLPQAALTVDAANPTGAVWLYESVGMTPAARWALYELPRD